MPSTPTFESTKRLITTKDFRIQVNEAGSGHPILMVHGAGPGASGWSNFAPNIAELSQKYRCIAVTMPGWGESSAQSLSTGRDQNQALCQLMDELMIDSAAFVGNSMGGMIALGMAGSEPERVSHLITMGSGSPGTDILTPSGGSLGMRALVAAYRDPSAENFKNLVQVMCFDPEFATDELAQERAEAARAFPQHNENWLSLWDAGLGAWSSAIGGAFDTADALAGALRDSRVPTLVVHGRDDQTVHFENSLRILALLQNSRLVLFSRCGHWAQLEHASEFNRLVDQFIQNN